MSIGTSIKQRACKLAAYGKEALVNFLQGGKYALLGIRDFFRYPRLWLYALLPFVGVTVVCIAICRTIMVFLIKPSTSWLEEYVAGWAGNTVGQILTTFILILSTVFMFVISASVKNNLYEMLGAVFFAKMVRQYEHMAFNRPLDPGISFFTDVWNMIACVWYAFVTLLLVLVFFGLSFFLPGLAQFLTVVIIGYRYGISYCSEAGFNRHLSLRKMQKTIKRKSRLVLYGFGITSFCMLLVPLISILLIPGLCLGGTILVNDYCQEKEEPHEIAAPQEESVEPVA